MSDTGKVSDDVNKGKSSIAQVIAQIGSTIVLLMIIGFLLTVKACACPVCKGDFSLGLCPGCQGDRKMTPAHYVILKLQPESERYRSAK